MKEVCSSVLRPKVSLPCRRPLASPRLRIAVGQRLRPASTTVFSTLAPVSDQPQPQQQAPSDAQPANGSNPATAPQPAAPSSTFPWTAHWYPVAIEAELDPKRPHATQLLGIPIALWRDKDGAWHAVEDMCPHRLAPLSEGRIEADGTLQCAYHGWQFNGSGACTHIPQLRGDDTAQKVACSSRRACVRSFPVQVVHELLWVLPDASPQAHERSGELPATALKELLGGPEAEGRTQTTKWFARDLAIRFDTLCENLIDPSHVPFAHHGVQGKREGEKGTTTRLVTDLTLEGFTFELDFKREGFPTTKPFFRAPNYFTYGSPFRSLHVFAMPTRPGWSRLFATFTKGSRQGPSRIPPLFDALYTFVESQTWLEHTLQRNAVLEGDTYILHIQERMLADRQGDWKRSFFMPAEADASVIAMRKWFDTIGGAVPTCEPDTPLPPVMTKREVLDRYSQHTENCSHCKKALRNTEVAAVVAAAAGAAVAAWLLSRLIGGLPLLAPATGWGVVGLAACGALAARLWRFREQFFFVDYVHAEKK